MTLKDKRKKLLEDLRVSNCYKGKAFLKIPMGNWINFLVEFEEQDKQAIKDLKELSARKHKYTTTGFLNEIDKIMGEWEE